MTIRWGIVTAGRISNDFVNAFKSYPEIGDQAIVAIAARNKDRAEEFAKTYDIEKVFDSYESLATSDDIDVAYIGALNVDHYDLTKLFLENGKHVLCEKPFCLNYKQAASLVELARSKKLFLMEAVWSRFAPAYAVLEDVINSGKLGDIKFVEANFGVPPDYNDGQERSKKQLNRSAVMDVGIYTLQFAQFVFKEEPKRITAVGELNEHGRHVVDTVILEYGGGRRAVLNMNVRLKLWNKATVVGTKGRVTLEDPFHFPDVMIHADGKTENFPLHTSNLSYNFINSPGLVYQAVEVARCINEGLLESPRMTHNDSLVLAKLEDSIRKQVGVHFDADDQEFV